MASPKLNSLRWFNDEQWMIVRMIAKLGGLGGGLGVYGGGAKIKPALVVEIDTCK